MTEQFGLSERVILRGFTPEADLGPLLSAATVLCFLSRYEGFGLPILDAFQCGTAVLCGNRTSLPEVGGDAAHYVDPYDLDSISAGLQEILERDDYRGKLARRGLERSQLFSWERTAETVARVFESVYLEQGRA
jgi:glycosyltransferase involved in cell wall biosynthesis